MFSPYKKLSNFVYFLYLFFKGLVLFCLYIFFPKIILRGKEHLTFDNPVILVSNHPNTMMDPLVVASHTSKVVFFLANASLFKHPLMNSILSVLYCIPIERPKDVNGRRISNADSFAKCDEFMQDNGCLYIAAEGRSVLRWQVGEIKTGAARIAFSAEKKNDFKMGLTIVPVGLTYSAPRLFRSKVFIQAGPPIKVADWRDAYEADPIKGVRLLTNEIRDRLAEQVIHTETEETEKVLRSVVEMDQSNAPKKFGAWYQRARGLATKIEQLKAEQPASYEKIREKTTNYFEQLKAFGLQDQFVKKVSEGSSTAFSLRSFYLAFIAPFFGFSWLHHALPNGLPWLLMKQLKLYIGYDSNVKVLTALLTYPLFYGLQIWLVHRFFHNGWITLGYVAFLIISGLFVSWYMDAIKAFWANRKSWQLQRKDPERFARLLQLRQAALLSMLNE